MEDSKVKEQLRGFRFLYMEGVSENGLKAINIALSWHDRIKALTAERDRLQSLLDGAKCVEKRLPVHEEHPDDAALQAAQQSNNMTYAYNEAIDDMRPYLAKKDKQIATLTEKCDRYERALRQIIDCAFRDRVKYIAKSVLNDIAHNALKK